MKVFAIKSNQEGNKLLEKGDHLAAEQKFIKATKQAPNWDAPWYNLGLVYKRLRKWEQSFECNDRATRLEPKNEGAWWNLGIAATALSNWRAARFAWTNFGIELPNGEGPIEMNLGFTPIRLNPETSGEVVWCDRIDPARAIIRNVPFPTSNHRFGDLILHDGEPNGYRQFRGHEVPVFDELELIEPSHFATFEVVIEASNSQDRESLLDLSNERAVILENWSKVRMLCHLCSKGRPHSEHEPQADENGPLVRYGVSAKEESEVRTLFDEWQNGRIGCLILELRCVLPNDGYVG